MKKIKRFSNLPDWACIVIYVTNVLLMIGLLMLFVSGLGIGFIKT